MAMCVRRPANSSVTPKLSAIGNAVGAGSATDGVVDSEPCVAAIRSVSPLSAADDVHDREHDDPHDIDEVPVHGEHFGALGVFSAHVIRATRAP